MLRRRVIALSAGFVLLAASPALASAEEHVTPYQTTVSLQEAQLIQDQTGTELDHAGFDGKSATQHLNLDLFPSQAAKLEDEGFELTEVTLPKLGPKAARATGGDSPNPYYDVYRSYSEAGGIADELRGLARDYPDVVKLVEIGKSMLGKPILTIKITANARNTPDGTRPAILYGATNHAREWITPEVVRREAHWILNHQDDVRVQEILRKTELWFLPVQNPDGYDYTFTCGIGTATKVCGPGDANSNRLWRKTLRDNNNDGIYGNAGDGVDPNRNFPEQWALDEEGSSANPANEDYRGPYANSEPENFAYDRLLRRIKPIANLNYHSAAQLLNSSFGFITNRPADDNTLARSLTGTDGDAAVDPYQPDQASDLYVTHGETVDWAYFQFGTIGFTPELDTAQTGGSSASSFVFPDDEDKVNAVFEKNLPLALNLAWSAAGDDFDRPRNFFDDASRYKVKATLDIEPTVFDVSYGGDQQVEAVVRKDLGPTDFQASVSGPGGRNQTLYLRGALYQGGERYGDVPGKYFQRVRATVPASFPPTGTTGTNANPRPVISGDTVTITVRAGGQEQVFTYKVVSTQQDKTKKRILVVAAEDYTGTAPNKTPYATAPRYLAQHVDALKAAGYDVDTYNIDAPPGTIKYPTFLGVLSHFDGVLYYTGDDLVPQDPGLTNYRRLSSATTLTGDTLISQWGAKGWFNLRDYLNEGGKIVIDGRNAHQTFASSSTSATAYSGYQFNPDPFYGFNYPADNLGDDNRPGSAFIRQHQVNNDIEQYFFGVGSRTGGAGSTTYNTAPIAPTANSIFAGVAPFTVDTAAGDDPTQDLDGNATPRAKSITRLRTFTSVLSSPSLQQPLRQEKAELDSQTTPAQTANGGVAISTRDTVAFGFGLEQVDQSTREALVSKAFGYLLPATPDTTAPVVDFTYPLELKEVTAIDPVDLEVKGYDDRGDIKEVRLFANDTLVKAKRSFPFQFRYYVPANAAANSVITFKAEAEDKAGNVKTITRQVRVVSAAALAQTPIAVGLPILTGTPTVGSTLTLTNIAFINTPTSTRYVWYRDGDVISGADKVTYTLVATDLGHLITARVYAGNADGEGDAAPRNGLYVSAAAGAKGDKGDTGATGPAGTNGTNGTNGATGATGATGAPGPVGPAGPKGDKGDKGDAPNVRVTCDLAADGKSVVCTITAIPPTTAKAAIKGTVRIAGTNKTTKISGKGKVKVRLRSSKKLKKAPKVVVKLGSAKSRTYSAR